MTVHTAIAHAARTASARPGMPSPGPRPARQAHLAAAHAEVPSHRISLAATITVIVLIAVNLRPGIVSIGPLLGPLRQEFQFSNAQASLLTAIPTLLMGLLALPTPWLARRLGRQRVVLLALMLLGGATLLRAFATSTGALLAATAGVGAGIAVTGTLIAGFVKTHHPERVALLMGLYAASLGLGSTAAAALTGPVAHATGGWRVASALWAVPVLAAIAVWRTVGGAERALAPAASANGHSAHPHPIRSLAAWRVALYFAANNVLFFGLLAWLVPLATERGAAPAEASLMLAGFTSVFMLANPLPALLSRHHDRRPAIVLFTSAVLLGIAWLLADPHRVSALAIALLAAGIGGSFSLGMTLPLDHTRDAEQANRWTAFTLAIGYGLGALGPIGIGLLRDDQHSFTPGLWLLAAAGLLMLGLAPWLRPRPSLAA